MCILSTWGGVVVIAVVEKGGVEISWMTEVCRGIVQYRQIGNRLIDTDLSVCSALVQLLESTPSYPCSSLLLSPLLSPLSCLPNWCFPQPLDSGLASTLQLKDKTELYIDLFLYVIHTPAKTKKEIMAAEQSQNFETLQLHAGKPPSPRLILFKQFPKKGCS